MAVRKWGLLLAWSATVLLICLAPLAVGWSHLPDQVATHWDGSGTPDGSIALSVVPLVSLGLIALALLTTPLFRVEGEPSAESFAMVGLLGGLALALNLALVGLNWDVPTWEQADTFAWLDIVLILLSALVGAGVGYTLGRRAQPVRIAATTKEESIEVAPAENVSWVGRVSVRWPLFLLGGGALLTLAVPVVGPWLGGLMVLSALALMNVEANVNNDGLTVRLGGIPVRRIALGGVSSARSIDLEPAAWGGWGWRANSGATALVLRRGEALEVTLNGGRRFAVTVDDPATGAALLNGLVSRRLGDL
ncbi:MAG: DUF1648 domain-containing protein [Acidimicrobiia bacterium]